MDNVHEKYVYHRADGRWEARYIIGRSNSGKAIFKSVYGKTLEEAVAKRNALYKEPLCNYTNANLSFSNLAYQWLSATKSHVKESTYCQYQRHIRKHIEPYFENVLCDTVSTETLSEYVEYLQKDHALSGRKKLAPSSTAQLLNLVKAIIQYGIDSNISSFQNCCLKRVTVRIPNKSMRVLSIPEQHKLESELLTDMDQIKFAILLTLYSGMRIGEVCALTWDDIYNNEIHISKTMYRINRLPTVDNPKRTEIIIAEPKTASSIRTVPIPNTIMPYVDYFKYNTKTTFILKGKRFSYMEPRTLSKLYSSILNKCDIRNATYHTLRHTFATRAAENGFEIKTLSELLGHSNVATTLNRYVHSSTENKRKNMNLLHLYVTK